MGLVKGIGMVIYFFLDFYGVVWCFPRFEFVFKFEFGFEFEFDFLVQKRMDMVCNKFVMTYIYAKIHHGRNINHTQPTKILPQHKTQTQITSNSNLIKNPSLPFHFYFKIMMKIFVMVTIGLPITL